MILQCSKRHCTLSCAGFSVTQLKPRHRCSVMSACSSAGESKRPKRYFPFAEGPRSCVGQSLAKVSLLATMATLMQHFHFCLADEVSPLPACLR